jgi:hypothetical protein
MALVVTMLTTAMPADVALQDPALVDADLRAVEALDPAPPLPMRAASRSINSQRGKPTECAAELVANIVDIV